MHNGVLCRAKSGAPAWSPNGQRIAFHGYITGNQQRIFTMDADGSDEHQLAAAIPAHGYVDARAGLRRSMWAS